MQKGSEGEMHDARPQPASDDVMRWLRGATSGTPTDEATEDMRAISERYAAKMAEAISKLTLGA